ncbi:MAG TPA: hypothetical protein VFD59_10665 [Nocardioidaceae bacterium]|nr:hypothetical protein [Nocardioidaceae bacterium]
MAFTGNIEAEISAMHETLTLVLARLVDTVEALAILKELADHLGKIEARLASLERIAKASTG